LQSSLPNRIADLGEDERRRYKRLAGNMQRFRAIGFSFGENPFSGNAVVNYKAHR
jgi:hypothetical protein